MHDITTPEQILANAFNHFVWACIIRKDVVEQTYRPDFNSPFVFQDTERDIQYTVQNTITSNQVQADHSMVYSLCFCVTSIWEEWLLHQPLDNVDDEFKSVRTIFRHLRNVFQHGMFTPMWDIRQERERVVVTFGPTSINVEEGRILPISLNFNELHGESFTIGSINGVCGFLLMLKWLIQWEQANRARIRFLTKSDVYR